MKSPNINHLVYIVAVVLILLIIITTYLSTLPKSSDAVASLINNYSELIKYGFTGLLGLFVLHKYKGNKDDEE